MGSNDRLGVGLAAGAGLAYAVTLILQGALAEHGVGSSTVLTFRFGVSAVLLLGLCRLRGVPPRPARGDGLPLFLLGAICFMAAAASYFAAISRGTTAAVIVLVYLYPVLVTVTECVRTRRLPSGRTAGVLAMSVTGCALVAVAGGSVSIQPLGVLFALGSAAAYTLYIVVGTRVGERSDPTSSAAWVALGAAVSFVTLAVTGPGYADVAGHLPALLGVGTANAIAFGLTFAALARLGAARASVVLTLEAVFTVILSAVVLDESLAPLQLVGAAAVVVAAATVVGSRNEHEAIERAVTVP